MEKGYASVKVYPSFSLHVSVIAKEPNKEDDEIDVLLVDYIVMHFEGMEIFIAVHRDGKYKIMLKCREERFKQKIAEGVGERVHVNDKEELEVFLDHFEIFIVKYLQEIINNYSDRIPGRCEQLVHDILSQLQ